MQSTAFQKYNFRDLSKVIRVSLNSKLGFQPIIMYGAPGGGKTVFFEVYFPRIIAEHYGVSPEDVAVVIEKPARRDAAEMAGVALPKEATAEDEAFGLTEGEWFTEFTVSPILVKVRQKIAEGYKYVVLIFDEVGQAGNPEQKLLSDCFDPREHSIGGNKLPRECFVVGTTNRAQDKAGAFRLLSMLTNRALPVEVSIPVEHWIEDYCIPNGVNPIGTECALAHADSGFFASEVPAEQGAFCTRRSYTVALAQLDSFMESPDFDGTIPRWMEKMLASNIGDSSAKILTDWIHRRDEVPTVEEMMNNPEGCRVPDQTGFQMIAANMAMGNVEDVRTATAALKYICRLRTDLQVSLGVKLMTISSKAGWLINDPAAHRFIQDFQQFLPLAYNEMK
jgi:hypothetical protein